MYMQGPGLQTELKLPLPACPVLLCRYHGHGTIPSQRQAPPLCTATLQQPPCFRCATCLRMSRTSVDLFVCQAYGEVCLMTRNRTACMREAVIKQKQRLCLCGNQGYAVPGRAAPRCPRRNAPSSPQGARPGGTARRHWPGEAEAAGAARGRRPASYLSSRWAGRCRQWLSTAKPNLPARAFSSCRASQGAIWVMQMTNA